MNSKPINFDSKAVFDLKENKKKKEKEKEKRKKIKKEFWFFLISKKLLSFFF